MSRALLYAIVFIEGFCSLGAEVIALRRLVPHVGSSIVITAPTIGFFLLALALGYAAGARVSEGFTRVVARNFLVSALLAGLGLVYLTVLHLENRDSGRKETKLRLGLMVACLGSILLSASRSALVATLMGVGYVFFMYFRHAPKKLFRALLALFFLGILLVPFVQHFGANTLAKQQAKLSMGSAMSSRTQLWEDRATEFLSSPLYGVGFASQKIISFKQSLVTGIIEPGTSYGAVFAMTGLLGGIPFLFILFGAFLEHAGMIRLFNALALVGIVRALHGMSFGALSTSAATA